jgi:outer membrane protein OmpA-like peptidoglycan-associated protein
MIPNIYHLVKLVQLTLLVSWLAACTVLPKVTPKPIVPLNFDTAIHRMAYHLLNQVKIGAKSLESTRPIVIVVDHFVDTTRSKTVTSSQPIEQMIADVSQKHFNSLFTIMPFTPQNLRQGHYMISGVIDNQANKTNDYYRMSASIVSLKTGKVMAKSQEFISSSGWLTQSTSLPAAEIPNEIIPNQATVGEISWEETGLKSKEYYTSLTTAALLTEADTAYDQENYKKSVALLNLAAQRPDGKLMKTYAGLYQSYLQLKQQALAAQAFYQLLAVSAEKNKKLNTKFLFLPDSTELLDDKELRAEYDFWLPQIANYFKNNNQCFQIEGYSTFAESNQTNQLALLRAQKIQNLMAIDFPNIKQKSTTVGKKLEKQSNKTDSSEVIDTLNRRVEIVVVACSPT